MTLWVKNNFIILISYVLISLSWAKPASTITMHVLDDSELSKITDHDHSDKSSLSHRHEPLMNKKKGTTEFN